MNGAAPTHQVRDALEEALAPAPMQGRLGRALDVGPARAARVDSIQLLSTNPGGRAVVRYVVDVGHGPCAVVGKLFGDADRARAAACVLTTISDATDGRVLVPPVVAVEHDLAMVLYRELPGPSLDRATGPTAALGYGAAGRWLAALHASPIEFERRFDADHEIKIAAQWCETIARGGGALESLAAELHRTLVDGLGAHDKSTDVPIHKDFHAGHVIGGWPQGVERIGAIDLDEARMGPAALDVAHFATNSALSASRGNGAVDAPALAAFLDAYRASRALPAPAELDLYRRYTCLKVAKQLVVGRGPRPRPVDSRRIQMAALTLREGLR
jgi:aminoglycoside/choline kinase family phosphotransferase